jgi:ankyrin repeat protein
MRAAFPPFDREKFQALVEAGANLDARRKDGCTGLHLACAGGEENAVAAWIEAGADVNAQTPEGASALMLAAHLPDIGRRLIASGADVNTTDNDGHTALVYAILSESSHQKERRLEAITTLIAAGTDVNLRDRGGVTPLAHARGALRRVQLEEEVLYAFNPAARARTDRERDDQQIAATIVRLIEAAGGSAR